VNGRGFFNQGTQGAKVYAEASNIKESKNAEENNFGKKKDKEKIIMLNWSQENYIHKFVNQKYEPKRRATIRAIKEKKIIIVT
ncbi:612_t:CDS:1, partial [Gigaspora margarita]